MGQVTAISWADHTFNPVRGCSKVSPGCKFCYAEGVAKRNPAVLGTWGPRGTRAVAAEKYWQEPVKWNREAQAAGVRRRVFCASLADVFEDRPEWDAPRLRLLELIRTTPQLDWLLLTKRPENIKPLLLRAYEQNIKPGRESEPWTDLAQVYHSVELEQLLAMWLFYEEPEGPANVWLGTSVENQEEAEIRLPYLLSVPAVVHWLSCEPLVGAVDLASMRCKCTLAAAGEVCPSCHDSGQVLHYIDWVVVGGESGNNPGIRPMHPQWAQQLRDQCQQAGVAFHFKQWGEFIPISQLSNDAHDALYRLASYAQQMVDGQGMEPALAAELFGQECTVRTCHVNYDATVGQGLEIATGEHNPPGTTCMMMFRVGKEKAGRLLDGVLHDAVPVPAVYTGALSSI